MFGKLCKYEWRYMLRIFLPMWALVLVLSVVNRFTLFLDNTSGASERFVTLALLALVFACGALGIVAIVMIVQRFYQGLMKDEGYLMFTLPVKSGMLINAKGVTAVLLLAITGIVGALVFVIISTRLVTWEDIHNTFEDLIRSLNRYQISGFTVFMAVLWGVIAGLMGIAAQLYQIYLAIAIGQLGKKHRVALAVISYLGINIVLSWLTSWAAYFMGRSEVLKDWFHTWDFNNFAESFKFMVGVEALSAVVAFLLTLVFFFITRYILEKHLNLE